MYDRPGSPRQAYGSARTGPRPAPVHDERQGGVARAVLQPAPSWPHGVPAVLLSWGWIYGVGAFIPTYMVDHGVTPHFVFLTFTLIGDIFPPSI